MPPDQARRGGMLVARRLHEAERLKPPFTVATAGDFVCALASVLLWEELTHDLGWSRKRYVEHIHACLVGTLLLPDAPARRRR